VFDGSGRLEYDLNQTKHVLDAVHVVVVTHSAHPMPEGGPPQMVAKKTFADDAEAFTEDLKDFVSKTRDALADLVEDHKTLAAEAKPGADEGVVWGALARAVGTFGDVERSLGMLAAVVQDLGNTVATTLGARDADDDVPAYAPGQTSTVPPQGPTPAESKEAEEAAAKASAEADKADEPKKAAAKKSS
jgi:hypothetical protein